MSADRRDREMEALRERLSRINESLDVDTALRAVMDNAHSLTGTRHGVMTLIDDGALHDFQSSGLNAEESERLWLSSRSSVPKRHATGIASP